MSFAMSGVRVGGAAPCAAPSRDLRAAGETLHDMFKIDPKLVCADFAASCRRALRGVCSEMRFL